MQFNWQDIRFDYQQKKNFFKLYQRAALRYYVYVEKTSPYFMSEAVNKILLYLPDSHKMKYSLLPVLVSAPV